MRTYGEIRGVSFRKVGFSIYHLANEYKISNGQETISVYVNSMAELKAEISKITK